jgi:YVTN family beta-propeller protein
MINLSTNENTGVAADGVIFGGNVSSAVLVSPDKAFVGVMLDDWTTGIIPFNPQTGAVGARIEGIVDGWGGLAFDGEKLYVGDRGLGSADVVVVNPHTNAVEQRIQTSMPPAGLAIFYADN